MLDEVQTKYILFDTKVSERNFSMNFKRILVLVMTFAMIVTTFAPTLGVFAEAINEGHEHESKKDLVYVSLGDSMTNGYGLDGYDGEAGVYDYGYDSYANNFAEMLAEKYGVNVTHHQLALSAARPEDINFLLNLDYSNPAIVELLNKYPSDDLVCWSCGDHSGVPYEDIVYCAVCKWDHIDLPGWGVQRDDGKSVDDYEAWWTLVQGKKWADLIGTGDFWTWKELVEDYRFGTVATHIKANYGTPEEQEAAKQLIASNPAKPRDPMSNGEETCYVAKHYQEVVKNADVISLAIGNGNFGVWLMGRITTALMDYDGVAANGVYDLNTVLDTCDPEFKEEMINLLNEIDPMIDEYVTTMMGDGLDADVKKSIKDVCIYGVVSFIVNYRHTIDSILRLNPDVEIVLTGLMNTYAGDSVNADEGVVTIGDILDTMFPLLNAYIVGLPTYMEHTGNELYKNAKFYYAEEYTIECLIQNFGDEDFYNWVGVSRDRFVTGLVGECDCGNGHNTDNAEACEDWDYGIFWELLDGFDMGGITIERITSYDIKMYEAFNNNERVAFAIQNKDKAGSIAVYLAIEDAVCKSGRLAPVTLSTLTGLELGNPAILNKALSNFTSEQEKIIGDYYDDAISGLKAFGIEEPTETQRNDMSMILSLPVALSNALWTDADLCSMLAVVARNKLGNGLGAHPSVAGHKNLSDAMIESYNQGGIPAGVVLEKLYDIYTFAGEYGLFESFPELSVLEEIYVYLSSNKYITDEQALDIIFYVYDAIEDKELSEADITNIGKYVYTSLIRNPNLSDTDRVAIVGSVYLILKTNNYLNEYTALEVVEEIYNALAAEKLITDAQAYAIVDYVYETISDGVSDNDVLDIIRFVYYKLVKNETPVSRFARKRAASAQDDIAAAKTLRIILGVVADNYFAEEDKKSVDKLISNDDALISDELLLKLAENMVSDMESDESNDSAALIDQMTQTITQTILEDPNTDDATKMEIINEVVLIIQNNGAADNENGEIVFEGLDVAKKIYDNLNAEGLLSDKEVMQIISCIYGPLTSGEQLDVEDVVDIVIDVHNVVFGRDDLTTEQKFRIVAIVYQTLDDEGYITEENIEYIGGLIVEYYDEAYFEAYKYLEDNNYIELSVEGIDKAIAALRVAYDEVDAGLLGVTEELKEKIKAELVATIRTLEEIQLVLANGTADDVDGFVAAILALEDDLYTHLDNLYAILEQAGIDVNQLVILPALNEAIRIINDEVLPQIIATANAFTNAVVEYVQAKLDALYTELLGISKEVYNQMIETIVKIQLQVGEKIENAITPILNTYFTLVDALTEIYGSVEEAIRAADEIITNIVDKFNYIDGKLNGALSTLLEKTADTYAELLKNLYASFDSVEEAIEAANALLESLINKFDGTVAGAIEAYNALVNKLTEIYGSVEKAIEEAERIFNDIASKVDGAIEDGVELYNKIIDVLAKTYGHVENVVVVAGQIFSYVSDFATENFAPEQIKSFFDGIVDIVSDAYGKTEDAYYIATQIYAYILNAAEHAFEGNYEITLDSAYVSLGNAVYGKELAGMLFLSDKYHNFSLTEDYLDAIAGADLITIRLDNGETLNFVLSRLQNSGTPLDWDKYLDEEGQAALQELLASLRAELIASGNADKIADELQEIVGKYLELPPTAALTPETVANVVSNIIEGALYSYAELVNRTLTVLDNVYTTAPDATVVITGIQNPLDSFDLELGEYEYVFDYVVSALNAQLVAVAVANENTIFVDSLDAADIYDALNTTHTHVYEHYCLGTVCLICGEERVAPGHSFTNYVVIEEATCAHPAKEQATCDHCGATTTREVEGSQLEHTFGEWTTILEATTEANGLRERVCSVCGHREQETIPMLAPQPIKSSPWALAVVGAIIVVYILFTQRKRFTKPSEKDGKKSSSKGKGGKKSAPANKNGKKAAPAKKNGKKKHNKKK